MLGATAADQADNDACSADTRVAGADAQSGVRMLAVGMRSQDVVAWIHTYGMGARILDTSAVQQHIAAHTAVPRTVRVRGADDHHRRQVA